jgi:hypothetical protein
MQTSLRSLAKKMINSAFSPFGIKVVRTNGHDWSDTRTFLPFKETTNNAASMNITIEEYIETVINNLPGSTQQTIDDMSRLGVFKGRIETVLEIGPGSGRYLERTIAACSPKRYEVYETSLPWAKFVAEKYGVVLQPTEGSSLKATASNSVDLVQAHKVFSGIPFLPTCKYWAEMVRVARNGAFIVFDIVTEACLDTDAIQKWIESSIEYGAYPAVAPRDVVLRYFEAQHCDLIGTFMVPIGPATTEAFVFCKR